MATNQLRQGAGAAGKLGAVTGEERDRGDAERRVRVHRVTAGLVGRDRQPRAGGRQAANGGGRVEQAELLGPPGSVLVVSSNSSARLFASHDIVPPKPTPMVIGPMWKPFPADRRERVYFRL